MSGPQAKTAEDEGKLIKLLLQKKIINDAQLKAALDFQKSVGGEILDVLFNLGVVRSSKIEQLLEAAEEGTDGTQESTHSLDPELVDLGALTIHHRLCDKLPPEILDRHLICLFFPVAQASSRKLIIGHGRPVSGELVAKIRGLLGVDVCSLALEEERAAAFLGEYKERKQPQRGRRAEAPAEPREPPTRVERRAEADLGDEGHIVKALVGLLMKKGVITAEELQVERELMKALRR
jgi:hypothetical protein